MIKFGYKNKAISLIRAILSIITGGILLYLGKGYGIDVIAQVVAVFLTCSGVISLIFSITKSKTSSQGLNIFNSIIAIIVGCLVFFNAATAMNILIVAIGIILIGLGVFQLITLTSLFFAGVFSIFPIILSVILLAIGILLAINPEFIKNFLSWIIGVALILYGISDIISFFFHKKIDKERESEEYKEDVNQKNGNFGYSEIKDVSYEKVDEEDSYIDEQ